MKWLMLMGMAMTAAAGENTPAASPHGGALSLEVLELRVEVYRQGVELQDWKIRQIERDLEASRAEGKRLDLEEQGLAYELTSEDSETGEVGARKADISSVDLPQARDLRRVTEQRLADLGSRLLVEQDRRRSLRERAEQAERRLREFSAAVGKEPPP